MFKKIALISLLVIALVLSGCSDDKNKDADEKRNKKNSSRKAKTIEAQVKETCKKLDLTEVSKGHRDSKDTNLEPLRQHWVKYLNQYKQINSLLKNISKSEKNATKKTGYESLIADTNVILEQGATYRDLVLPYLASVDYATSSLPFNEEIATMRSFTASSTPLVDALNTAEVHFWINAKKIVPFDCLKKPVIPYGFYPRTQASEPDISVYY
jgi:hypothetical protein